MGAAKTSPPNKNWNKSTFAPSGGERTASGTVAPVSDFGRKFLCPAKVAKEVASES